MKKVGLIIIALAITLLGLNGYAREKEAPSVHGEHRVNEALLDFLQTYTKVMEAESHDISNGWAEQDVADLAHDRLAWGSIITFDALRSGSMEATLVSSDLVGEYGTPPEYLRPFGAGNTDSNNEPHDVNVVTWRFNEKSKAPHTAAMMIRWDSSTLPSWRHFALRDGKTKEILVQNMTSQDCLIRSGDKVNLEIYTVLR